MRKQRCEMTRLHFSPPSYLYKMLLRIVMLPQSLVALARKPPLAASTRREEL
jgi:hypothetical protein